MYFHCPHACYDGHFTFAHKRCQFIRSLLLHTGWIVQLHSAACTICHLHENNGIFITKFSFVFPFFFFFILGSFFLRQIYSCANRLVHHTIQQCGFVHLTTIQKQEVHTTSNSTQTHILSFTQLRNKVTSSAEPTVILIALQ